MDGDPLVLEEFEHCRRDVGVFPADQLRSVLDDSHPRPETTHGLSQFQPDIASADDDQVLREAVQIQQLDMRHRPGGRETGHVGTVACVPKSRNTRSPRSRRLAPSLASTSTDRSPTKRASPMISSAPLAW